MSGESVRVTAVNHATIDIACAPQMVWRDITENFLEGRQFTQQGYRLEPLTDDPTAFLGGYRIVLLGESGAIADDRIVRITERDQDALRLSLCAEYCIPKEMALVVNASYQAVRTASGTRYELHSYSNFNLPPPGTGAGPGLAATVTNFASQAAGFLDKRLAATKVRLEAQLAGS